MQERMCQVDLKKSSKVGWCWKDGEMDESHFAGAPKYGKRRSLWRKHMD